MKQRVPKRMWEAEDQGAGFKILGEIPPNRTIMLTQKGFELWNGPLSVGEDELWGIKIDDCYFLAKLNDTMLEEMEIESFIRALFLGGGPFTECTILENVAHIHDENGNNVIITCDKAKKCLDILFDEYEEDNPDYPDEDKMSDILWSRLGELQKECLKSID